MLGKRVLIGTVGWERVQRWDDAGSMVLAGVVKRGMGLE